MNFTVTSIQILEFRCNIMKLLALLLLTGLFSSANFPRILNHSSGIKNTSVASKGFAVVELFTSEGCSSCPPADQLIGQIQKEMQDQPVYILAFHVDYWNRLGWKDVFSSSEFSKRQRTYANWLNSTSVYTPQLIVNGKEELVGSNEPALRKAMKSNLSKPSVSQLSISNIRKSQGEFTLTFQATGETATSSLVLALIQKTAHSNVTDGENRGRILSHVQVVIELKNISLMNKKQGTASIIIPKNVSDSPLELIAFLQQANGEITAATKTKL